MAVRDSLAEMHPSGAFERTPSTFRNWIRADGSTEFVPEAGRYLLYVSYACPWASRCLAARVVKGLEDVIEVAVTAPIWGPTKPEVDDHRGWLFDPGVPAATHDPVFDAKTLREVYEKAGGKDAKKITVPLLLDKSTKKIVNNESSDILRMFNAEFNGLAKHPEVDLYPAQYRGEIDEINQEIYDAVNNGVYNCGFATKQEPYERAFKELFRVLAKYSTILETKRYLVGNQLTEADIRFCMTLFRFDEEDAADFRNLFLYACDVYQTGGIGGTVNMDHIKAHYYGSHQKLNPYGIIPLGDPESRDFTVRHGREKLT